MKIFLAVAVATLALLLGVLSAAYGRRVESSAILPREQLALAGLEGSYRTLEDQIAPVVTDVATRRAIVRFLVSNGASLAAAERDLQESVRARLGGGAGVVYVTSGGVAWVATERRP